MRTTIRLACVIVLAVLSLAATTTTATAKGPTDVAVEGPGVHEQLTYTRRSGDVDLGSLAQAALLYQHWDGSGLGEAPSLSPDQLGPSYVLTWTVGSTAWAVQHAYPFAEGGAWVEFGKGSGWVKAPGLTQQLVALGASADAVERAVAEVEADSGVSAEPEAPRSDADRGTSYDVAVVAGVAVAVALGAGALLLWRRRVSR